MPQTSTTFVIHDERFRAIVGEAPTLELLAENLQYPFAHEAGVYIPEINEVFITSNRLVDASGKQAVKITRVVLPSGLEGTTTRCEEIESSASIPMANGGVNYKDNRVLFCAQGSFDMPSGLYEMSAKAPYLSKLVVSSFHGRPFNSVNDVVIHSDGSIWFTDPSYGSEQGYRPPPRLPSQVYRFEPQTGAIRAMADGFGHPNGICFSPDEKTVYITDTDWLHGDGSTDDTRPSAMYAIPASMNLHFEERERPFEPCFFTNAWFSYAFDVSFYQDEPFLTNRRLFAVADTGIPDGIKCDMQGNVYSGCGDGINV